MSNKTQTILKFNHSKRQFYTELKKRVDCYFKENQVSKHGNLNLYLKTVFMFGAYLIPYFLILFNVFESRITWFLLTIVMGFATAGIGLCVMHDALHGSYSKNQ